MAINACATLVRNDRAASGRIVKQLIQEGVTELRDERGEKSADSARSRILSLTASVPEAL
jgi:hypothetical protein